MYRRLLESLRVVLAIIAGLLLLDAHSQASRESLSLAILAFSVYSMILLWQVVNGSSFAQGRIFHWLDAGWFLLLIGLAGEARTHYLPFLLFPVFFAAWRTGYHESIAIAGLSSIASVVVLALHEPDISWPRLLAFPSSLFVVAPLFVALSRVEAAAWKSQAFATSLVEEVDPRRGFDDLVPVLTARIAVELRASVAILALRTFEGRCRVFCWEDGEGSSERSEMAAVPMAEQILSLPDDLALGWSDVQRWWRRGRLIGHWSSGALLSPGQVDRATLMALVGLVGQPRLISVARCVPGIGHMRLVFAGESIDVDARSLEVLTQLVDQIGPSVENAYLRERLAAEVADTERARIGRDLHDSALQPYIGLKFGLEAVQRRAGPDNPVAPDLACLVERASEELATMREVISGLRGAPGNGGALLSNAVRRQAARFGQLFGIEVEVAVEGEMPVGRRIAGELFHIVAEGLSNIRQHSQARRAWISLRAEEGLLVLDMRNENDPEAPPPVDFTPISLTERAAALGGSVELARDASATTVTVRVPTLARKADWRARG